MKRSYDDEKFRWLAVKTRDPHASGQFVYAVKTTGIYCRPGCQSRMPKKENVVFYDNFVQAELDGFRPCKRCNPESVSSNKQQMDIIINACRILETSEEIPNTSLLAKKVGMSASYFHRLFKKIVGITPKQYVKALQSRRLKTSLSEGGTVSHAIYEAGFNSANRAYVHAQKRLAMTPKVFQKGAQDIFIEYTFFESYLGWAIMAMTNKKICMIEIGEKPDDLYRLLRESYPRAHIVKNDHEMQSLVEQVRRYFENPIGHIDLPLDIQGTAFQQRVWEELRKVPYGDTASYSEIAERIGKPRAVRAVAGACASNRFPVIVPCHRIINRNGTAGNYRWTKERKQLLLEREK